MAGGAQCSCTCLHLNPGWRLPCTRSAPVLHLPCTGPGRKKGNRLLGGSLHLLFLEYAQQPLGEAPASSGVVASSSHSRHLERAAAAANAMAARQPGWTERLILGVTHWKSGPVSWALLRYVMIPPCERLLIASPKTPDIGVLEKGIAPNEPNETEA